MKTKMGLGMICAFPLLACASVPGNTVTASAGGHPKSAVSSSVTYRATCPEATYALESDGTAKTVAFHVEGDVSAPVELARSPLGQIFLDKKLHGKVTLACGMPGLYLQFNGYKAGANGPKPVGYMVIIEKGGILSHNEPLYETNENEILRNSME
ncbi:hypothetical protein HH212_14050 [Massilia forsythiae]|uniref:Lipoprotein n=1 Tax=Massilia forsythiae TaxID=2728020 RepID=A0A7Z2ZTA3_9BURK|nr:hypothetical protein [Massilia forsythiae]QJE01015.1 hypothetical protein HH212_14050 [Massilia forsythiae]